MRYQDDIDEIFDDLTSLSILQRKTIKERYRFMMADYRRRCRFYTVMFYLLRMTMTVGSLAVPALLSIQTTKTSESAMYWFTWGLSLAVTTANGITTLFKLDKRFFLLHATAERLRTETWQFVQLSGRYSGHHGHVKPSHTNQFVYYCSQLEKIHMKRVDEEYIKNADMDSAHHPTGGAPPAQNQQQTIAMLVPSPPDQALATPLKQQLLQQQDQNSQTNQNSQNNQNNQNSQNNQNNRRDSESTIGSNDTAIHIAIAEAEAEAGAGTEAGTEAEADTKKRAVSVPRSQESAVSATGTVRLTILPAASDVQAVTTVGR